MLPSPLHVLGEGLLPQIPCQPLGEHPAQGVNSRAVWLVLQDPCR